MVGTNDAGNAHHGRLQTGFFPYFDLPGKLKNFMMARPIFQANANIATSDHIGMWISMM